MEHGKIYTCKTLRLLGYLKQKGFIPFATEPDAQNGKFNVFKFWNTPELEKAVTEYFDIMQLQNAKKINQYDKYGHYITTFNSIKDTPYESVNIIKCCKGEIETAYGYIWRFAE